MRAAYAALMVSDKQFICTLLQKTGTIRQGKLCLFLCESEKACGSFSACM